MKDTPFQTPDALPLSTRETHSPVSTAKGNLEENMKRYNTKYHNIVDNSFKNCKTAENQVPNKSGNQDTSLLSAEQNHSPVYNVKGNVEERLKRYETKYQSRVDYGFENCNTVENQVPRKSGNQKVGHSTPLNLLYVYPMKINHCTYLVYNGTPNPFPPIPGEIHEQFLYPNIWCYTVYLFKLFK